MANQNISRVGLPSCAIISIFPQTELRLSGSAQGNFKCTWAIEHFSTYDSRVGKSIQSKGFLIEQKGIEWNLQIFPGGRSEESRGYVSCHLNVKKGTTEGLKLKFGLQVCNTNGDVLFNSAHDDWVVLTAAGYGYDKTIVAKDLDSKLKNDTLVFLVEATYSMSCVKERDEHRWPEISPMMKVIDDWRNLWISKENVDCVISVAGVDLYVHSVVLGARSKVFAAMFRHETLEKDTRRVEISDFERKTMESMLEFVYCGKVERMNFDLALELLRASDKYDLVDLKLYCSNFLISLFNDDNICQILVSSDTYNAEKLRSEAVRYFWANMSSEAFDAQRSIFKARPELIYEVVKELLRRRK